MDDLVEAALLKQVFQHFDVSEIPVDKSEGFAQRADFVEVPLLDRRAVKRI